MIGISEIGVYIPEKRVSNLALLEKFETDEAFLTEKIGVMSRSVKSEGQTTSDLCVKAFESLMKKMPLEISKIECCVVITQNPDYAIPHVSAIVHGKLGLPESCAVFDISLGCSGYVYGLSILTSFMKSMGFKMGLLFTADPYSDIVNPEDKNTAMIFGDAATVSLLEESGRLVPKAYQLGSKGSAYQNLIKEQSLFMNGRAVFNFTAGVVPKSIEQLLEKRALMKEDIAYWYFHQGSKYIVDTISTRLGLNSDLVVFDMYDYGNTVSSSIPILLAKDSARWCAGQNLVLSGFGVGLSWASCVIQVTK